MSKNNYHKYYNHQRQNTEPTVAENPEVIVEEVVEEAVEEVAEEIVEEIVVDGPTEVEPEPVILKRELPTGTVVDCTRLRVRQRPNVKADVLAELEAGSKVRIVKEVGEFYAVSTELIESGYCMKKFIAVEQ